MAKPVPPPRPYRDYLIPRLHERFGTTLLYSGAVCYAVAVIMSPWSWLMLVPYPKTLVRMVLLLLVVAMLLILRISNAHIGLRNQTGLQQIRSFGRWSRTFLWYAASSWLFCETYMWTAASSRNLGWIDQGKSWERPKLNERPIYMRTLFFLLAIMQTCIHLYHDYDRIPMPGEQQKPQSQSQKSMLERYLGPSIYKGLLNLPNTAPLRIASVGAFVVISSVLYSIPLIRPITVGLHRFFADNNPFWNLRQGDSSFKEKGLLFLITIFYSIVLTTLWEISNFVFTRTIAQPPLKGDKLISSLGTDPNTSLIIGLKGKREIIRTMAFWELAILAEAHPERRQTIYKEFDRPKDGPTWTQISTICQSELNGVSNRINPAPAAAAPQPEIKGLPRMANKGLLSDNISTGPPKSDHPHQSAFGTFAKSIGQSPGAPLPLAGQRQKLLEYVPDSAKVQNLQKKPKTWLNAFIRSPAGLPFRQSFARRANATIHGAPIGRENTIRHAASALSNLTIYSLKEDEYGQVQKDVPDIIRTYVKNIKAIEKFVKELQPHWTDIAFKEEDRKVPEVEQTLKALKKGLEAVLGAFGEYMSELGLTNAEVVAAKRAISNGPEMKERRG